MKPLNNRNTISNNGNSLNVVLDVIVFTDDNLFYAYSPALDLLGYGVDSDEAEKSFDINFDEFVKFTMENKTLDDELEKLGWKKKNKADDAFTPPDLSQLFRKNNQLKDIVKNQREFTRKTHEFAIA